MTLTEERRRSVGFIERGGEEWACFLVTFQDRSRRWHGYFSFRPRDAEGEKDEVRTADIFLEHSEPDIDRKARGLGRPLLSGLLASALHTREQEGGGPPRLRRWFRELLTENSRRMVGVLEDDTRAEERTLSELRSLYASYRMDQVIHLISLVEADDFHEAVGLILEGASFDFSARDRLQFAMMVVEQLEALLTLPPFEVWVEDYLANEDEYRLYTHTLHRDGRLP